MSRFVFVIRARDWRRPGCYALFVFALCIFGFAAGAPWWWLAVWIGIACDGLLRVVRPALRLSRDGAIVVVGPLESLPVAAALVALSALPYSYPRHTREELCGAGLVFLIIGSVHVLRRPVRLTPSGITMPSLLGQVYIPWEAISTQQIAVDDRVPLRLDSPELVVRRGWTRAFRNVVALPNGGMRSDDLAAVLDFYVGHQAARTAIGSLAGMADLKRVLAEPPGLAVSP